MKQPPIFPNQLNRHLFLLFYFFLLQALDVVELPVAYLSVLEPDLIVFHPVLLAHLPLLLILDQLTLLLIHRRHTLDQMQLEVKIHQ
jgi:hypothetical protein